MNTAQLFVVAAILFWALATGRARAVVEAMLSGGQGTTGAGQRQASLGAGLPASAQWRDPNALWAATGNQPVARSWLDGAF